MTNDMKILSDGFVWKLVDHETAKKIWQEDILPLYMLYSDGSEALVESRRQMEDGIEFGLQFGIEVGNLSEFGKLAPSTIEFVKSIIPPIKWEKDGKNLYGDSQIITFMITENARIELFANGKSLSYHTSIERAKEEAERCNLERMLKIIGIKI